MLVNTLLVLQMRSTIYITALKLSFRAGISYVSFSSKAHFYYCGPYNAGTALQLVHLSRSTPLASRFAWSTPETTPPEGALPHSFHH